MISKVRRLALVMILISIAAGLAGQGRGQQTPPILSESLAGLDSFELYCAPCHGSSGSGDGRVAPALRTRPADLTTLARRSGGAFPRDRVRGFVEGTGRPLAAHGSTEMPVWGQMFRAFESDARVRERIGNLVAYIESIQVPSTAPDDTGSRLFRTYCASCHGSAGRGDATARGGVYCLREAGKVLGLNLNGATTAIQGYGNAGSFAHKLGTELLGLNVVAVSDSRGGIYSPDSLDYEKVMAHKEKTGSVVGFPGAKAITNEELLELDVTILFPSALENVITEANAARVKAKISAELANGPTTPEADKILHANGVYVIPDFLCNAGGVTVSYFEMVQNAYGYYWEEAMVYERLDKKMTAAFHAVHNAAQQYKVHNRLAAYLVAVSRVAEAVRLRGWA